MCKIKFPKVLTILELIICNKGLELHQYTKRCYEFWALNVVTGTTEKWQVCLFPGQIYGHNDGQPNSRDLRRERHTSENVLGSQNVTRPISAWQPAPAGEVPQVEAITIANFAGGPAA